ncbi:MAG: squalene/phytoene synthase family protein [Sulfitobacter sp.]
MSEADDLAACAALVQRGDPFRFRCAMGAPLAARRVLFPLYAFNVEVSRAPWVTGEPMIAEMRLQWWRDVCEHIGNGRPPRRHEVATPLAGLLDAQGAQSLDELVAARRWDIYKDPFEDAAHFETYIDRTAGNLMWTSARALGPADEEAVRGAAYAAGLAAWLLAIPALEEAGRVPLIDGTQDALRDLARDGLARLQQARQNRRAISAAAAPALLPAATAHVVLRAAAAQPGRVASGSLPNGQRQLGFTLRALTGRW